MTADGFRRDDGRGVVVLLKRADRFAAMARAIAGHLLGPEVRFEEARFGDSFPDDLAASRPRAIISFLSPWIIPREMLEVAELAINFHAASRDYPGHGCYNFALYEEAAEYGAVCHFMAPKVDTGSIIAERRFPILPSETVETIKFRSLVTMVGLFHDVLGRLAVGERLEPCGLNWTRGPFYRRDLEALTRITPDMTPEEIRRRVRATTYPGYPGAWTELGGERFEAPVPHREPLA